jgi:hypothetical protein
MSFFLNTPAQQAPLSDEQLEQLALDNIEKMKSQLKKKICGCCAAEDEADKAEEQKNTELDRI